MFRHKLCKLGEALNLCLITKWFCQISKVHSFNKNIDVTSLRLLSKAATDITENFLVIALFPSLGIHKQVTTLT